LLQEKNLGAPRNWNRVVQEAQGEFFKWTSANDYTAPGMVECCLNELKTDRSLVLCYGRTQLVDEEGNPIQVWHDDQSYECDSPSQRFYDVCLNLGMNNPHVGLFRLSTLRRTRLERYYPSGDLALMAELALYGKFRLIPEVLQYRTQSTDTFTSLLSPLELQRFYSPGANSPMKLIYTRRVVDHLMSIARSPVVMAEKVRAFRLAIRLIRWNKAEIVKEIFSLGTRR